MVRPLEPAANPQIDLTLTDLGPLAWVIEEMRKAVGGATRALKRFVQDSEGLSPAEKSASDASQLRVARQQLHQAAGAMDMVGQAAPANILRAMESAVQQCVQRPAVCNDDAVTRIERAGFGLLQYLETLLQGKPASAVALFPQYRDVQALAGQQRAHPADLWPLEWRWVDPQIAPPASALAYEAGVREQFEHAVLHVIKNKDQASALILRDLSLGFSAAQTAKQPLVFWKITAAFFEALAFNLCPSDVHVKRAISRVLHQYSALVRGELGVTDRLAQDLVFFCAQAKPPPNMATVALDSVRQSFGLLSWETVDYENSPFGRFDPALLTQARKRIGAVKEAWSSVAGGDLSRVRGLTDQFSLVSDSLVKLHPPSTALAVALTKAADATVRSGVAPSTSLAMEVATAVMFLEAVFEELDPADLELAKRTARLAERLERVQSGAKAEPLEPWIEELYRRVSDRQTMGSVVGELRTSLSDLERTLDQYFRAPQDTAQLVTVPGQLSQMRGVLSVLGLDHAVKAVLRMRDIVEKIMDTAVDPAKARAAGAFDKLGNNLGALGLLFDMLNYQPVLAKKLFLFDEELDELTPMMGRMSAAGSAQGSSIENDGAPEGALSEAVDGSTESAEPEALRQFLPTNFDLPGEEFPAVDKAFLATTVSTSALGALNSGYGEARDSSLMGDDELLLNLFDLPQPATPAVMPLAILPAQAVDTSGEDIEDDDLLGIFLEEASEVVTSGKGATAALASNPDNADQLTILRRAFHTLKGSSRMVGLSEFGEAAWSLEQLLNTWLADRRPASPELISLSDEALTCFGEWANDIASGDTTRWTVKMFQTAVEALRTENRAQPIRVGLVPVAQTLAVMATEPETVVLRIPVVVTTSNTDRDDALLIEKLTRLQAVDETLVPSFADALPSEALPVAVLSVDAPLADAAVDVAPADDLPLETDVFAVFLAEEALLAEAAEKEKEVLLAVPVFESVLESVTNAEPIPVEIDVPSAAGSVDLDTDKDPPFAVLAVEMPMTELPVHSPEHLELNKLSSGEFSVNDDEVSHSGFNTIDEKIKAIGPLRIGIPLYNVYLNEADEWSRRLLAELSEWQIELDKRPLSDATVSLAHSLAGSSATVGFEALSGLARELEHSLQWTQIQAVGTQLEGRVYAAVAEDIRRLLHQFAAGFLKDPDPQTLDDLRQLHADKGQPPLVESSVDFMDDDATWTLAPETHLEPRGHAALDLSPVAWSEPVVTPMLVPMAVPVAAPIDEPQLVTPPPIALAAMSPQLVVIQTVTATEDDDEIDAVDALDPDLFQFFEEEAVDLMPALGGALRQWVARPDDMQSRAEALRTLHTLKGSARLAGAMRLGERAHRLESVIERLGEDRAKADMVLMGSLLARFDVMQSNFEALVVPDSNSTELLSVVRDAEVVAVPTSVVALPLVADSAAAGTVAGLVGGVAVVTFGGNSTADETAVDAVPLTAPVVVPTAVSALRAASASTIAAPKAVQGQTIRIRAQLLDSLVNQTGEVMMTRSRLEAGVGQLRASMLDLTSNLERLRQQLRDVELQAELQMQSRLAQTKDADRSFDPLEFDRFTRVQELTRMMAESVNDVATVQRNLVRSLDSADANLVAQARQARELQRDLLRTRMQEFESISERLYRVIRQASKDSGKQVKLDIVGGAIELDRGVLDRMTPAFEHLLRNAVAHGIENTDDRAALGKPTVGTIVIALHHEGNDVSITFSDDGLGLNEDRILSKAVSLGLLSPGQELVRADLLNLIFTPGFSTATQVTELAGRGIGMDVVRSEVLALGGRIETTSVRNAGTQFKLILPLTTAVTRVVMVRMGELSVGIPANVVEQVRRTPLSELTQAYATESFSAGGVSMPFFWAGALLQSSARSSEVVVKTASVVVLRSAQQLIAIHVDEVLGNQEVVVKNLGPQLSRLPGLSGMTVLPSGAVVLIYNPVALASVYGTGAIELQRSAQGDATNPMLVPDARSAVSKQVPLVLVVDDSITVRRVTQRMLQREGYRVALAVDGIQGLERLREEMPTVILSDIEMPRMDGFEFARSVRSNRLWKDLPIITISSRTAEKHREIAREIGVNHYLGKPYGEEELLGLIRGYVMLNTVKT